MAVKLCFSTTDTTNTAPGGVSQFFISFCNLVIYAIVPNHAKMLFTVFSNSY